MIMSDKQSANLLEQARAIINEVDGEMEKLFERRMEAARMVAEYKKQNGLPILDALREEGPPPVPYVNNESEGFYSCFPAYFQAIDEAYEEAFGKGEEK